MRAVRTSLLSSLACGTAAFSPWLIAFVVLSGACDDGEPPTSHADAGPGDTQTLDAGADTEESEADAGPRMLVHNALWSPAGADEDPFHENQPAPCPPDSFGEELLGGELVFYVRTESCPALTVHQAIRHEIAAGDRIRVRAFHFPLTAPVESVARLIVQLGDSEVWRAELPIPSAQGELAEDWVAPHAFARGTPAWFHVENHGANEYVLIGIELSPR